MSSKKRKSLDAPPPSSSSRAAAAYPVSKKKRADDQEESTFHRAQRENWAGMFKKKSAARLLAEKQGKGAAVRVYADGIYDMFHYGHARSLMQAKQLFPNATLVVGVSSDEDTRRIKGLTVMNLEQRAESVRHCKWADEVVPGAPWVVTPQFLKEHRIDYVVHGEDPSTDEDGNDAYGWLKDAQKFLTIKRTEGISTSDIILKIVRDYDRYVRRNLNRGYSRKEMNVSLVKESQLRLEDTLSHLKEDLHEGVQGFLGKFNSVWHKLISPDMHGTEDESIEEK